MSFRSGSNSTVYTGTVATIVKYASSRAARRFASPGDNSWACVNSARKAAAGSTSVIRGARTPAPRERTQIDAISAARR